MYAFDTSYVIQVIKGSQPGRVLHGLHHDDPATSAP